MSRKNTRSNKPNQSQSQLSAANISQFGNKDKDSKHDLSKLKVPKDHYVVRHFSTVTLMNGQEMEDPTSSRFQVYDKQTFEDMNTQHVKAGKQLPSKFENLGLRVDVLHDPSLEGEDAKAEVAGIE